MKNILAIASDYVTKQLESYLPHGITYHNIVHTLEAVDTVKLIGEKSPITSLQMEALLLAAWFHDIGYIEDYHDHEGKSAERCQEFLRQYNYPADILEIIVRIILSTKLPHKPSDLLEEIMCDADICYMGKKEFNSRSKQLREEWKNMTGKIFSDDEWIKINIDFLQENKFHTNYAKSIYDEQKKMNLANLKKKLSQIPVR